MKRTLRIVSSLRTTAILIVVLSVLLLLNVAVPQEVTAGVDTIDQIAARSATANFFLRTLGFANMPTSPVFLGALALFFVNLIAVLLERTIPTFKRIRARVPSEDTIAKWTGSAKALHAPLPENWSVKKVLETLRGFGYKPGRVADGMWWGIKHRTAPLGFLIFHLSFFFLCAGGLLIYYTRFVGGVRLVEGQNFDGFVQDIMRTPPIGLPPPSPFTLVSVKPTFESGEPTDLRATIRLSGAGQMTAWVNHPAKWGSETLLVLEAGLAPVLWIQDDEGFTVERLSIAAPTRSQESVSIPLGEDGIELLLRPVVAPDAFPDREGLANTPFELSLEHGEQELFQGELTKGGSFSAGGYRVILEDVRYWAGFLVVDERGGSLLIIGFVLGTIGAIWRLMTHRREIVLSWDDAEFHLAGRGEFFIGRFQDELATIRDTLASDTEPKSPDKPTTGETS